MDHLVPYIDSELFAQTKDMSIKLSEKAYIWLQWSVQEHQKISNHDTDEIRERLKQKFS